MSADQFDQEIIQEFFVEAEKAADDVEAGLIQLDSGQVSQSVIDAMFRSIHNLKGAAKTIGFESLSRFSHVFEDALTQIRKGTLIPDREICSTLLRALDILKSLVHGLKTNHAYNLDTTLIERELVALQSQKTPPKTAEQTADKSVEKTSNSQASPQSHSPTPAPEAVSSAPKAPPSQQGATPPANTPAADEFLRVSSLKLDQLINFVGELVINQSIMSRHRQENTTGSDHAVQTISYMEKLVNEIQDVAMGLRMVPVKGMFQKMQRTVRDASNGLKKDVDFQTEGEHVELDRAIIERIGDPLNHLIRNAVDHGVEDTQTRMANGKSPRSTIRLLAEQKDDKVMVTVSDDGRGLDAKKLIAKAIEKGILPEGTELDDADAYGLIFEPGFSTKDQVTDISGRGVGMDVVMRAVEEMKGSIHIETKLGQGTSFIISLPLSLSIITGMVVLVNERKYVVPIAQMTETLDYKKFKIETSTKRGRMINLRGDVIPVVSLDKILHGRNAVQKAPLLSEQEQNTKVTASGIVTIFNGRKVSFEIDQLLGPQHVVIKKLGPKMADLPGIIGGAILSNGEPSLILNLYEIAGKLRGENAN